VANLKSRPSLPRQFAVLIEVRNEFFHVIVVATDLDLFVRGGVKAIN
jgi:hypothetical protein